MLSRLFRFWVGTVIVLDSVKTLAIAKEPTIKCLTLTPEKLPSSTLSTYNIESFLKKAHNSKQKTNVIQGDIDITEGDGPDRNAIVMRRGQGPLRDENIYILFQQTPRLTKSFVRPVPVKPPNLPHLTTRAILM